MTCEELAQIITRRAVARARTEPDPALYFTRAIARVAALDHVPVERMESELIKFGKEFGLLSPELDKVN